MTNDNPNKISKIIDFSNKVVKTSHVVTKFTLNVSEKITKSSL